MRRNGAHWRFLRHSVRTLRTAPPGRITVGAIRCSISGMIFSDDGRLEERERAGKDDPTGSLCVSLVVPANGSAEVTFFLTWHFPNRTTWKETGSNHPHSLDQTGIRVGNYLHDKVCQRLGRGRLHGEESRMAGSGNAGLCRRRLRERPTGRGQGIRPLQPEHTALADRISHAGRFHVRLGRL